jgi:hypothetical protein
VSIGEDEVESPFQQYIRLASVPVADGLFPKSERWRDVARCLPDGGPDSDAVEMKSLQSFYAQFLMCRQKGQPGRRECRHGRQCVNGRGNAEKS